MRMGTVGTYVVRIYPDDTRRHRRPHLHVIGPNDNVVLGLPDLDVVVGDIPSRDLDMARRWAHEHLKHLCDTWNDLNPGFPVRPP